MQSVHPRVYGEYAPPGRPPASQIGSSPRVRGIHSRASRVILPIRFIPACTGNTRSLDYISIRCPVHPRVYGEYSPSHSVQLLRYGSSPRVRGILVAQVVCHDSSRFIPACTGNTYRPVTGSGYIAVHPRVYGEYLKSSASSAVIRGSSPRVRGILDGSGNVLTLTRFIPACTGNTRSCR